MINNKIIKLLLISLMGIFLTVFNYFVYSSWMRIIEYNYYCIGNICKIWFDLNPTPMFIITGLTIGFTVWYICKIFTLILQYFGAVKA